MGTTAPTAAAEEQTETLIALADQLENKLATLDRLGAHIAAAHIDVAIARIRADAGAG